MRTVEMPGLILVLLGIATVALYVSAESENTRQLDCGSAKKLGRFNPVSDLLVANFDNKPDTDDLLAAAGLATMLRDQRFACVRYIAVTGAYGEGPERVTGKARAWHYIEVRTLFDLAFPGHWADAHSDHAGTVDSVTESALETVHAGGDVWIMEAGQSDLTASVALRLSELDPSINLRSRVHLVQHSDVNELLTTPAALAHVRNHLDYISIANGNIAGNGTPGFKTSGGAVWPALLRDPNVGPVWVEAQRLALNNNGKAGHTNETIAAGGLDFSDLVAAAYIFGFEDLADVHGFVDEFVTP